jgi:hypothetical protein
MPMESGKPLNQLQKFTDLLENLATMSVNHEFPSESNLQVAHE